MTKLLEKAFAEAAKLSEEEQDALARVLTPSRRDSHFQCTSGNQERTQGL